MPHDFQTLSRSKYDGICTKKLDKILGNQLYSKNVKLSKMYANQLSFKMLDYYT